MKPKGVNEREPVIKVLTKRNAIKTEEGGAERGKINGKMSLNILRIDKQFSFCFPFFYVRLPPPSFHRDANSNVLKYHRNLNSCCFVNKQKESFIAYIYT